MNAARPILFSVLLLAAASAIGCAGYAGQVQDMRTALFQADREKALKEVNGALDLGDGDQYPLKVKSEDTLLLLERASVKHAMNDFRGSSLDYRIADRHLELLDVKRDPVGKIAEWIFSGDAGIYRAPSHEKLMLSTGNMLNYLAMGNLESARVEARRLDLAQQIFADEDEGTPALLGVGDYLSGFAFEMSGRYEQALQQYLDALKDTDYPHLKAVIRDIAPCTSYRTPEIDALLADVAPVTGAATTDGATTADDAVTEPLRCIHPDRETGTLLVVSSVGLAPHKQAVRLPIGAAIVIAGAFLAPDELARANDFAVRGLLKWVNFTELAPAASIYGGVDVAVDGVAAPVELGQDMAAVVQRSWDDVKGKMLAAAIVRMIARAAAGAGTNAAVEAATGESIFGLLAQVVVEGTMTVADTPDTRCWNTLPKTIYITRMEVPAGTHRVNVRWKGARDGGIDTEVNVNAGGFVVLPIHSMR